jgi:hypothetical protein
MKMLTKRLEEAKRKAAKAKLEEEIQMLEQRVKTSEDKELLARKRVIEECSRSASLPAMHQPNQPPAAVSAAAPFELEKTLSHGMDKGKLYMQMRKLHEQTKRQCFMNDMQMTNVFYENFVYGGSCF